MRNISVLATILQTQPKGENNYLITYLTAEEGICTATLYGGAKSKLKSLVSPMNSGILYIYKDETKNAIKINDFDVKSYHLSVKENLFKTLAFSFAAEILIKTHCAGSPNQAWILFNAFIDGMEYFDERESRIGLPRFLWRYISILGIKPDISECEQCGIHFKNIFNGKMMGNALSYNNDFNGFLCFDCQKTLHNKNCINISENTINYLEAIETLSPKEVRQINVDEITCSEIKNVCIQILENACMSRFKTLESCKGII